MKKILYIIACAGVATVPLAAQETENNFFTAAFGAGFTTPVYGTGSQLDTGWNASGQAGVNLFNAHLAVVGEFQFNDLGVNTATLNGLGFPGGSTQVWDFSADPIIRFRPQSRVSFYLIGGPGVYHRYTEFTRPGVAFFTGFNPFFGIFYPVAVPVNQVVLSYSTTSFGVNGGGGINFSLVPGGHTKFFAEARYNEMYTRPRTSYLPVTFGFRW